MVSISMLNGAKYGLGDVVGSRPLTKKDLANVEFMKRDLQKQIARMSRK